MRATKPLVSDAGERLRVASRAPLDVYVPTFDGARFVGDHTGNYWPFRWGTLAAAEDDRQAAERTVDRCESFRLDLGPGDCHAAPDDLYRIAKTIGADEVVPRPLSTGPYQIEELFNDYRRYDFRSSSRLLLPVGLPYGAITREVSTALSRESGGPAGPPDVCLLVPPTSSVDVVVADARAVRDAVSGDTGVHLVGIVPSVELAAAVRREPNLFDSVAVPRHGVDVVEVDDDRGLSATGRRDLGDDADSAVALAADFSLLCSSYVDDEGLFSAGYDSVVPRRSVGHS